jgi:hypothetical protein
MKRTSFAMRSTLIWTLATTIFTVLAGCSSAPQQPVSAPAPQPVADTATSHYTSLANLPFDGGYATPEGIKMLQDELLFQRGVQSYIWALPALKIYAMKEGSEAKFGAGYNVLPIWRNVSTRKRWSRRLTRT